MHYYRYIAMALGMILLAGSNGLCAEAIADLEGADKEMSLGDYLRQIGSQVDCYFTVEAAGDVSSEGAIAMFYKRAVFDLGANTGAAVAKSIEKAIPGVKVVQSARCPAIYNICRRGDLGAGDYWLDQKISVSFSGKLDGLINCLMEVFVGHVTFVHTVVFGSAITMPQMKSHINIMAQNMPAREVITCFLPFSQRQRILWLCSTRRQNDRQVVDLLYGSTADVPKSKNASPVPFDHGEEAFRGNTKSPELIKAAIDYIIKEMATKEPRQVRWAMFYLGKYGATSEMPLLFKFLNYKYTDGAVVEEMYPAVGALAMMGTEAANEALKRLRSEEDPLRLELLRQVAICIVGKEKAADLVRDQVLKQATEEQKSRIEKASLQNWPTDLPVPTGK